MQKEEAPQIGKEEQATAPLHYLSHGEEMKPLPLAGERSSRYVSTSCQRRKREDRTRLRHRVSLGIAVPPFKRRAPLPVFFIAGAAIVVNAARSFSVLGFLCVVA